jgi:hypothetical protein
MDNIYNKDDINNLYIDFYKYVSNIISKIHSNNISKSSLFYCNYSILNTNEYVFLPLTICLGGSSFIQYNNIFNSENKLLQLEITTLDYDISFSLNNKIKPDSYNKFIKQIKDICKEELKLYKYKNLSNKIFSLDYDINLQRLYIKIDCNTKLNPKFHILELSFWLNGKISDNFTINDFIKNELFIYNGSNTYYLLPLFLLIKTTLYAIVDNFERRKFKKCIKYIERIKFIKKYYDKYKESKTENLIINKIYKEYILFIKRKYEMINDYPYILSYIYEKYNINDNKIISCINKKSREYNRNKLLLIIKEYIDECKENKTDSEISDTNIKFN